MTETYSWGYDDAILRGHRWRTADNSAAYLLPELRPGMKLLDVGCGPGTITLDLAARIAPGAVLGLDYEPSVIDEARRRLDDSGIRNVEFAVGDVYSLDFDDGEFDVVHGHQVVQQLSEPVQALVELRRVLRSRGVLAVRDGALGGWVWAPADPLLDRWHEIFRGTATHRDGGRNLPGWVAAAGFSDIHVGTSTWTFADSSSRGWFGEQWAERLTSGALATQIVSDGLSDREELEEISQAWRRWAGEEAGFFAMLHVEVLARS
jgi:SAM-dependent methyltransferase